MILCMLQMGLSFSLETFCFCPLNCLLTYHLLRSPAHILAHSHFICSHPRSPTMLFIWLLDQPTFLSAHLLARIPSHPVAHHIHLPARSPSYLLTCLLAHLYSFTCWPTCLYTYFLFALLLLAWKAIILA